MSDEHFETGYKKPPQHARFSKGKSGNPKGRPSRKSVGYADILHREVCVEVNGKPEKVPVGEAVGLKLFQSALKGKRRAARAILNNATKLGLEKIEPEWVPYVKVYLDPTNCLAFLLAVGAVRKVSDEYNTAGDHQGYYRIELWFLEETLKRQRPEKFDMERLARSTVDPDGAMQVFERLGYGKFSLEEVSRPPRPPMPPEYPYDAG